MKEPRRGKFVETESRVRGYWRAVGGGAVFNGTEFLFGMMKEVLKTNDDDSYKTL